MSVENSFSVSSSSNSRYQRQSALPQVSIQGQDKLSQSRVLIIGAGGLGLPVSAYLAGAGIGHLTLVDGDSVELSNLHRQVWFTETDIGANKAQTMAAHLRRLNSAIEIQAVPQYLSSSNVAGLLNEYDIIVDAADNFAVTYLLSDHCLQQGKYLVAASALECRGYVGIFCGTVPSYRALFPRVPEDVETCVSASVLGSSVAVVATLQAQEIIKLIVAPEHSLQGKLLSLDLWVSGSDGNCDNRFQTMNFSAATEPQTDTIVGFIAESELRPDDYLVDVRHIDTDNLAILFERDERLVLSCQSGRRALQAAQTIKAQKIQASSSGEIVVLI